MRKRTVTSLTAICLLLFLFSSCGFFEEGEKQTPEYNMPLTVNQTENDEDFNGVIPDEPETEGVKLNESELDSLYKMLFGNTYGENWYLRSLPVIWNTDNPADIDLYKLFYNGFVGECDNLTDEELEELSWQSGFSISEIEKMGQFRLPEARMDLVLREYYGITFTESNRVGLNNCYYISSTGCYYVLRNDSYSYTVGIHSAYEQADGSFIIYYSSNENNPAPQYVMQLVPNDFGSYTITVNKQVSR